MRSHTQCGDQAAVAELYLGSIYVIDFGSSYRAKDKLWHDRVPAILYSARTRAIEMIYAAVAFSQWRGMLNNKNELRYPFQ